MFSRTVRRHAGAVPRANVPPCSGADASRNACTTPVRFEKVHETRCFLQSTCERKRTARNAAVHVVHADDASAKVYGDCRNTSTGPGISGAAQARLRETAQAGRPPDVLPQNNSGPRFDHRERRWRIESAAWKAHALGCDDRTPHAPLRASGKQRGKLAMTWHSDREGGIIPAHSSMGNGTRRRPAWKECRRQRRPVATAIAGDAAAASDHGTDTETTNGRRK